MKSRWLAIITYRTYHTHIEVPHDIEELSELEDIVERGPCWDTIFDIKITKQRDPVETTIEEAENE